MFKAYIRLNGQLTNVYVQSNHIYEVLAELHCRFIGSKFALVSLKEVE